MSAAVKIVLLGDSGVGKTSIVTQYVSGEIPETVNPTIGAAFVTKDVSVSGSNLELLIWDTAGQEVYRGLAPMYYRSALIAFIVFDVTKQESFDSVSYWIKELRTNGEENIIISIVGNKVDLDERREVEYSKAEAMAQENGALYCETSAQTGAGVERMFQVALSTYVQNQQHKEVQTGSTVKIQGDNNQQGKKGGCC